MRVVVTGAMGFVGINIARELAASDHDVVAVDLAPPDALATEYLRDVSGRITPIVADISDDRWPTALDVDGPDAIVHAAAITPLGNFEPHQAVLAAQVNVAATARILNWAAGGGARTIIHVSTGSVYGPVAGNDPVDEDTVQRPDSVYGITKLAGERLAWRLAELSRLNLTITRLSHVYGPMERGSPARAMLSPVERWTRALLAGEPIESPHPDARRDFVHVSDVARAIRLFVDQGNVGRATYNLSSGVLTSEDELLEILRGIEPALTTRTSTGDAASSPRRPPLSISRVADAVGWRPEIPLEEGLRTYVDWRRSSGG